MAPLLGGGGRAGGGLTEMIEMGRLYDGSPSLYAGLTMPAGVEPALSPRGFWAGEGFGEGLVGRAGATTTSTYDPGKSPISSGLLSDAIFPIDSVIRVDEGGEDGMG